MTTRRDFFAILGITTAAVAAGAGAAGATTYKALSKPVEPKLKASALALVGGDISMHVQLVRYSYIMDGRKDNLQVELVVQDEMHEYVIHFCAKSPWQRPDWIQDRFIDIVFKFKDSTPHMYVNGMYCAPCDALQTIEVRGDDIIAKTALWDFDAV